MTVIINHPTGTHHTMPRKWLEENGTIIVKGDAPENIVNEWNLIKSIGMIDSKRWNKFSRESAPYMIYKTIHGNYDYRTTLKIFDE
jgi:hypothetical protein